jgi:hypothetical protein
LPFRDPKLVVGLAAAALAGGVACAAVGLSAARAAKQPVRPLSVVRYSGPVSGELIEDPAALKQVLPEVNLDTMPLGRAIDSLRRSSGANIFVNWRRLDDAGLAGPDTPVKMELRLKNVTLGQALAKVLACVGERPEGVVSVGVRDGIITVSDGRAAEASVGRWYYVQDLLADSAHGFARSVPAPGPGQPAAPQSGALEYGTTWQERASQSIPRAGATLAGRAARSIPGRAD